MRVLILHLMWPLLTTQKCWKHFACLYPHMLICAACTCLCVGVVTLEYFYWWANLSAGSFFAKALFTRSEQDEEDEEQLSFKKNDLLMVRDTGPGDMWEGTMLSSGKHGLVPVNTMQPLPYPFYQWVTLCFSNETLLIQSPWFTLVATVWLTCFLVLVIRVAL